MDQDTYKIKRNNFVSTATALAAGAFTSDWGASQTNNGFEACKTPKSKKTSNRRRKNKAARKMRQRQRR